MFTAARKAAKALLLRNHKSEEDNISLSSQCIPTTFSVTQLNDELIGLRESSDQDKELEDLLILANCLRDSTRLQTGDDEQHLDDLSLWVSKAILPDGSIIAFEEAPEDDTTASRQTALLRLRYKATLGMKILQSLDILRSKSPSQPLSNQVLLSLLAFTSVQDPWTTASILSEARRILSKHITETHTPEFITTRLLQSFIRPLFSKSKPDTITASGRKAIPNNTPLKRHNFTQVRETKPWKYSAPHSLPVLQWAVENASQDIITQSWHLITPPILTLLDETSTAYRLRGLQILSSFLAKLSPKILAQSGLGEVFEDAVMPTLLYLPTLTPQEESILLLPTAYTALYVLSETRYPISSSSPQPDPTSARLAFFDRLLRKGVFPGYTHCSNHPAIVEILLHQTHSIVQKMGIQCVKHLKDIIPMLTTVLMDPFAMAKVSLVEEALGTLRAVLLNAWPRVGEERWRREVCRMLVVAWKDVREAEKEKDKDVEGLKRLRGEMEEVGRLFISAVNGRVDMEEELRPLIQIDASLKKLFGIESKG